MMSSERWKFGASIFGSGKANMTFQFCLKVFSACDEKWALLRFDIKALPILIRRFLATDKQLSSQLCSRNKISFTRKWTWRYSSASYCFALTAPRKEDFFSGVVKVENKDRKIEQRSEKRFRVESLLIDNYASLALLHEMFHQHLKKLSSENNSS